MIDALPEPTKAIVTLTVVGSLRIGEVAAASRVLLKPRLRNVRAGDPTCAKGPLAQVAKEIRGCRTIQYPL